MFIPGKRDLCRVRDCPSKCPEGAGLAQSLQHVLTLASLFVRPLGDEIPIEPALGRLDIGPGHLIVQGQTPIGGVRVKLSPVPHVLFRSEEVHLPSSFGYRRRPG